MPNARPRPTPTGTFPPNVAALFDADPAPRPLRRDRRDRPAAAAIRVGTETHPRVALDARPEYTPEQLSELKMRMTRALFFVGDDRDARRSLSAWKGVPRPDRRPDPPRPGRHLQPARGLHAGHRRPAPPAPEQPHRLARLVRRPVRPGTGLLPLRPVQGRRPAHRRHRHPPPRPRRRRAPREVHPAPSAVGREAMIDPAIARILAGNEAVHPAG